MSIGLYTQILGCANKRDPQLYKETRVRRSSLCGEMPLPQQFAEYNKEDNPACCWQQISEEGSGKASLSYYQRKAQPAPSI